MEDNGLILNSHFMPPEILARILSSVNPNDLVFNCRLVCKNWNQIVIDDVWKLKVLNSKFKSLSKLSDIERKRLKLPWYVFYQICSNDPYEKNLLLNNCGQNELLHWYCPLSYNSKTKSVFVLQYSQQGYGYFGGDDEPCWRHFYHTDGLNGDCVIEPHPIGADPLPECDDFEGHKSCFVTTHTACEKEQIIDLIQNGISGFVLDELKPKIIASEWIAGRYDCGFQYRLTVSLVSKDGKSVIQQKQVKRKSHEPLGSEWKKVSLEFENYDPGVRFVKFNHRGRDSKFWLGYYGIKMAGGVVRVALPNSTDSVVQP